MHFAEAKEAYYSLEDRLQRGEISEDEFLDRVAELEVTDPEGRRWRIAARGGRWLLHDGRKWVPADPDLPADEVLASTTKLTSEATLIPDVPPPDRPHSRPAPAAAPHPHEPDALDAVPSGTPALRDTMPETATRRVAVEAAAPAPRMRRWALPQLGAALTTLLILACVVAGGVSVWVLVLRDLGEGTPAPALPTEAALIQTYTPRPATPTYTPTWTPTPSRTPVPTDTPEPTHTPRPEPTAEGALTPVTESTATPTWTPIVVATTASPTAEATETRTPTPSATPTPTRRATATPTRTPTTSTATPRATNTPAPTAVPTARPAALSGKIAFTVWNLYEQKYDLFVSQIGGEGRNLLGTGFRQPQFRQDGVLLGVNGEAPGLDHLVKMTASGGEKVEVSNYSEDAFPTWSPDGAIVVYSTLSWGDGVSRLGMVNDMFGKGQDWIRSATTEVRGDYPFWMEDGRVVYHGCDFLVDSGSCSLYWVGAGGGAYTRLTTHTSDTAPAGHGEKVAFMSSRDGNWEVYRVNMDGSGQQRLTNNAANDGLPTWSPDGRSIAFVSDRDGKWAIWVMNADGGNQRKLFDLGGTYGSGEYDWTRERISWAP